jgi:hypothetical protein
MCDVLEMSDTDLEKKILTRIAQGSNTFYTLKFKEKIGSNDGILNTLERLRIKGLIKKGLKGPRRSQPYVLTEDGFDIVLRYLEDVNDFDSFVSAGKSYFPLVFCYWSLLEEYGLQEWVINTLKKQVPVIDVKIMSQLIAGDRSRYSHDEFINDLYDLVYGPWLMLDIWDESVSEIPIDEIRAFLKECPEIMQSRIKAYRKNEDTIQTMKKNNELYREKVLDEN